MKVRVTVRFRGREIDYPELALQDLKEVAEELSDISTVEQNPMLEGRVMFLVLTPAKPGKKKTPEPAPAAAAK
jgi:translation initiation factor IF-3